MGFDNTTNATDTWARRNAGGLTVLGGSLGGLGKIGSGYIGYKSERAMADVQSMNADQLDEEALRTEQEASANIARARHNEGLAVGEAALERSARNVTSGGTALAGELSLAQQAEIGINDISARAAHEAQTLRQQAEVKRWEAEQRRKAAKKKKFGGIISGAATIGGAVLGGHIGGGSGAITGAKLGSSIF